MTLPLTIFMNMETETTSMHYIAVIGRAVFYSPTVLLRFCYLVLVYFD